MGVPIRILLVEDNDVYRASLELLLGMQAGIEVVGSVSDGAAAAAACLAAQADVVLMDLRLPGLDGPAATEAVRATLPGPSSVVRLATVQGSGRYRTGAARSYPEEEACAYCADS